MASALVKLNVNDTPNYLMLIHSSNINRVTDYGTFRSVTYFDPLQGLMYDVSVSDSLDAIASQSGMIRVTATNIDDQAFDAPTVIAIQEFNISRVGEVQLGESEFQREINYLNKGGGNNIIRVTDTLDSIQQQTIAAGGVVPSLAIISPPAGTYVANNVTITLSSNAIGASIYYTIDGSTPTTSSTLYTAPFTIDINRTVRAIAVLVGVPQGGVTSAAINVKCFTPVSSPIGGLINSSTPITLTTATTSGTIRFTTNGADPTSSDTIYTSPLFFTGATTLKSRTFKANQVDSDVRTSSFTVFVEIMVAGAQSTNGRLWRSFNNGVTWTQMQPLGNTDQNWISVSAQYGGGFVLAGCTNRIFFSTDNGATWTEKFAPNANTFTGQFFSDDDGQNVIAIGQVIDAGLPNLFISTDYGDTWGTLVVDGFSTASTNGWGISIQGQTIITSRIVTLSPADTEIRISKDLGATWFTPTAAEVTNNNTFRSNAFISENENVIMATVGTTGGVFNGILISTDGGLNFRQTTTRPSPFGFVDGFMFGSSDSSRIFIARNSGTFNASIFYTDDLGFTWTEVQPKASPNTINFTSVGVSKGGKHILLTDSQRAFFSSNYGQSFSETQPAGATTRTWASALSKQSEIFKAETPIISPSSISPTSVSIVTNEVGGQIRYTTDGSTPTDSSTLYVNPFAVAADTTVRAICIVSGKDNSNVAIRHFPQSRRIALAAAQDVSGELWRSFDDGTSWTDIATGASGNWNAGLPNSGQYALAVASQNGLNIAANISGFNSRVSFDQGFSWQAMVVNNVLVGQGEAQGTLAISNDGNKIVFLSGRSGIDSSARLFVSTDGGRSFNERTPNPSLIRYNSVTITPDGSKIYVGRASGVGDTDPLIWTSTNDGVSWSSTYSNAQTTISSLSATNSALYMAISIAGIPQGIFRSINDGVTRTLVSMPNIGGSVCTIVTTSQDENLIIAGVQGLSRTGFNISVGGGAFTTQTWPASVNRAIRSIGISVDNQRVLIGTSTRLFLSTNGMTTLNEVQPAGNVDRNWFVSIT